MWHAHDGTVGCNTIKYMMTFLYFDWLFFFSIAWYKKQSCLYILFSTFTVIVISHLPEIQQTTKAWMN